MENIEQLKQDNAKLQERLNNAAKFFREQKAQIEALTSEVKEKTELALDYRNQIKSLTEENEELKRKPQDDYVSPEKWNALVNEKEDLNKQLNEYELKLQNSEAAYEELRKKYTEVKTLSDDSIQAGVELGKENAELQAKLKKLEANSISQEDFDDEVKRLNQTISECKKSYDERIEDISKLQMEVAKLEKDNTDLIQAAEQYKTAYAEVKSQYEMLGKKYQVRKEKESELLGKIDESEKTITSKDQAYKVLQDTYNKVFAELNELKTTTSKNVNAYEELKVQYDKLNEECNQYRSFMKALTELAKSVNIEWLSPNEMTDEQKKTLDEVTSQKKNTKSETPMMNVSEMTRML